MKRKITSLAVTFLVALFFVNVFAVPEGQFDWTTAKELHQGVLHTQISIETPRLMKIQAIRVDLTTPKLYFYGSKRAKNWGKKMPDAKDFVIRTQRETTRSFMINARKQGVNMIVACNAAPWRPWRSPWNHKYSDCTGLLITDGKLIAPAMEKRPSFFITKQGEFGIDQLPEDVAPEKYKLVVSGFNIILKNGNVVEIGKNLAPRVGYGLSKDKKFFYIFVVDGRQKNYSMGATKTEIGEWLKYLGAFDGIEMDGGGSATLLYYLGKNNKRKVKVNHYDIIKLNHHANDAERTVSSNVGICFEK